MMVGEGSLTVGLRAAYAIGTGPEHGHQIKQAWDETRSDGTSCGMVWLIPCIPGLLPAFSAACGTMEGFEAVRHENAGCAVGGLFVGALRMCR